MQIAIPASDLSIGPVPSELPALQNCAWFAVYTCTRHEKWVSRQLMERQIETFLPVHRAVHQWKDRRKTLELPLFPGYVFVHIAPGDRVRVLQAPGVVHLVSFNGKPAPLPFGVIETLRNAARQRVDMHPSKYLSAGERVRVVRGPLIGTEGILEHFKGKFRVVITLETLLRSVAVEIGAGDVEALS